MRFKSTTWIAWIGATVAAAITGTATALSYAHGVFQTKEDANKDKETSFLLLQEVREDVKYVRDRVDRIDEHTSGH